MTIHIEKRGQRFWADISLHDASGAYHRERKFVPGATKAEAMDSARARERWLYVNGNTEPPKAAPTLKEFGPRWIKEWGVANGEKPSTTDAKETSLRKHLVPVLGRLSLDAIGEAEIQKLKLHMTEEKMVAKTQKCVLLHLSGMLRVAQRWGELTRLPEFHWPKPETKEAEFYGFEEYEALVVGAARVGPMCLCAVLLGGDGGLRRGEVVALDQASCGTSHLTVSCNDWRGQIGSTKGNKIRRVPLTSRLAEAIAKVRHLRGPRLLYFKDSPINALHLNRWMEQACARAGLPRTQNFHRLRHTFGSHLAMKGAPVTVIQKLMGHANIRETMRYMHLAKGSAEAAIALLETAPAGARGVKDA